jgi:copper(I)-binding protein
VLALPAGKAVTLSPGGVHVMLMGIAQPLSEGARVPLTLVIEEKSGRRHDVSVSAAVKSITAGAAK